MRKIAVLLTIITIAACQKKSLPVITERKRDPAEQTKTTDTLTALIVPDTLSGKTVFENRCSKCHGLPEPSLYTAERWESILYAMMPKARLNDIQKIHLTAYINSNAKK